MNPLTFAWQPFIIVYERFAMIAMATGVAERITQRRRERRVRRGNCRVALSAASALSAPPRDLAQQRRTNALSSVPAVPVPPHGPTGEIPDMPFPSWSHGRRLSALAVLAASTAMACADGPTNTTPPVVPPPVVPISYVAGQSYFGRNGYVEYIAGNTPVILTAPHGGTLSPSSIPDRTASACGGSATITLAPSPANKMAMAFPMPDAAPVTIAVLFSSFFIVLNLSL